MLCVHIPSYNICLDKFIQQQTCYACFVTEDHVAANCPLKLQNPSFSVCFNCGEFTHTYKNCRADNRNYKCLNCDGNHNALSMACPSRKTSLKVNRQQSQHTTFAKSVKTSHAPPQINSNIVCKSVSLLVLAMLKKFEHPRYVFLRAKCTS